MYIEAKNRVRAASDIINTNRRRRWAQYMILLSIATFGFQDVESRDGLGWRNMYWR